jgi:hypothetical protein
MRQSLKTILALTLLSFLSFILCSPSYAQDSDVDVEGLERIASISTGDTAPFSGTLFSTAAAARLLADLETANELCSIKCDEAVEISRAEMQYQLDILQASKDAIQERFDATLDIRDDQIEFLEKHTMKSGISREMYFGVGVLGGVALTIGSAYVIHLSINDNQ